MMSKDIIYRDDGIKAIESDLDEIDALDPDAGIKKACIRRAVWKLMGVPSADRPQGWIPCSERLPKDGRYLCDYGDCIDFGRMTNGEWYVDGVIAWMPLPEPYREEQK